jgi:hypothetical protein
MTPASPRIKTAARVSPYRVAHGLLGGARGSDSAQASVELLSQSFGGRFTQPEQPCIVIDRSGQIGFNAEVLTEGSVGDARCRRRVLAVVDALTVGANSVDLAGALIALDLDHSALALAALLEMSLCNTNESDVK